MGDIDYIDYIHVYIDTVAYAMDSWKAHRGPGSEQYNIERNRSFRLFLSFPIGWGGGY